MTKSDASAASPGRTRLTGAARRESILRASQTEFARAGYHGASTASIARAAGCSEPMLYKHFAGKHALFTAVLQLISAEIEAAFDDALAQPGDVMERWDRFVPRMMKDPRYIEMLRLRKLAITMADQPQILAALQEINARHIQRTRIFVEQAIAGGHMDPDTDPDYVAWMWHGIMLAGCFRETLNPGGFSAMIPVARSFIDGLHP